MRRIRRHLFGFSLVEVTLAIGIVAFALVAIFSLFGSLLQSNKDVIDQAEVLSLNKALPAYLQAQGFSTVYGWVATPPSSTPAPPLLYAYNLSVVNGAPTPGQAATTAAGVAGKSTIIYSKDANFATEAAAGANRQGRLLGLYLTVSPNFPITTPNGIVAHPTYATLAGLSPLPSPSPGYTEAALAIQVNVYPVPQFNVAPSATTKPALTYDILVQH